MTEQKTKLFVSNLDFEVEQEELEGLFQEIGDYVSVVIARDRETRRSKGFAFVEMSTAEAAERAIDQLSNRNIRNRQIKVSYDRGKDGGDFSKGPRGVGAQNKPREFLPPIQRTQLFRRRKRMDPFLDDPTKAVDYKDVSILSRFMSERGKIMSRRLTGLTAYHQRKVSKAIKRAQHLGLLPFSN